MLRGITFAALTAAALLVGVHSAAALIATVGAVSSRVTVIAIEVPRDE